MKVEFNHRGFSADMSGSTEPAHKDGSMNIGALIKDNKSLLLGAIAFAIALANLPFGLIINLSGELMSEIFDATALHFVTVMLLLSAIMSVISVVCGVFAVAVYRKFQRGLGDKIGVLLAILSFVISAVCLTLDVVGLLVW